MGASTNLNTSNVQSVNTETASDLGVMDASKYTKEELIMEVIHMSNYAAKLKAQRDMLQSELLKLHRKGCS